MNTSHKAWLLAGLMLCAAQGWAMPGVRALVDADFRARGAESWQTVLLPDSWGSRGLPNKGDGQYRLAFDLPQAPSASDAPWALRATRLATVHRLTLNGVVLDSQGPGVANRAPARVMPAYIPIPASLLSTGRNELLVEVHCDMRCGLSPLELGPADLVFAAHQRHEVLWVTAPQIVNAATLSLALFMVLIWWRRRQEEAVGVFGLMWIPEILRNFSYLVTSSPLNPTLIQSTFFLISLENVCLMTLFAVALSPEPWPRTRRLCWWLVALAPMLVLAGAAADQIEALRKLVYPMLMPVLGFGLWLLWRALRAVHTWVFAVLWLAMGLVIASSLHDMLYLFGAFSIEDQFWQPWVAPLAFMSFAGFLLGRIGRALGDAEDLNVHLEQRVELRTSELRAANVAKTRFIASASHDLRQPLHALGLLVGLLEQRVTQPETRSVLTRVESSVEAMQTLLNAILDISRLDAGVEQPHIGPLPVAGLWQQLERSFSLAASRRGLQLRLRPSSLWVASDAHLIQRILNNLVNNALSYTRSGGVLVAARNRGDEVLIEVLDTGIGIPAQHLDEVFLEFVQLHNPERDRTKGLGLGLAIVRRTAALLQHRLEVVSRVGHGTLFRLHVPRVAVARPASASSEGASVDVSGLFVLVVDDEQDIRYAMHGLLTEWNCLVATARDGTEALASLAQPLRCPDVLVLDYRLPDGSGLEVARRLWAAAEAELPTLLITGDVTEGVLGDIAQSGLKVLHKPTNPDALKAWLAEVKAGLVLGEAADE